MRKGRRKAYRPSCRRQRLGRAYPRVREAWERAYRPGCVPSCVPYALRGLPAGRSSIGKSYALKVLRGLGSGLSAAATFFRIISIPIRPLHGLPFPALLWGHRPIRFLRFLKTLPVPSLSDLYVSPRHLRAAWYSHLRGRPVSPRPPLPRSACRVVRCIAPLPLYYSIQALTCQVGRACVFNAVIV